MTAAETSNYRFEEGPKPQFENPCMDPMEYLRSGYASLDPQVLYFGIRWKCLFDIGLVSSTVCAISTSDL